MARMPDKYQVVTIKLRNGMIGRFVGPAVFAGLEEGEQIIDKIEITKPSDMPSGCKFGTIGEKP